MLSNSRLSIARKLLQHEQNTNSVKFVGQRSQDKIYKSALAQEGDKNMVNNVDIKVKKLHDDAVLPTYGSEGAAGFDFYSIDDYSVDPGKTIIVKTGLAMAIPQGLYLAVVPRSGVSVKTGIRVANSPGTVDSDYRGEIGIIVDNISNDTIQIPKGYRIAQGVIIPYFVADFDVVDELDDTVRGSNGYGSTGVK